ncbi:MAG: hypothetical protein J5780_01070 [Treponema sp.]|nr:hypothetical protein [Treponema sp.]
MENSDRNRKLEKSKTSHTKYSVKYDVILASGLVFLLLGIVYGLLKLSSGNSDISVLAPVIFISCGEILLFITFAFTKGTGTFFCGMYFVLLGAILLFVRVRFSSVDLTDLWPLLVLISGVALFLTGIYRTKKIFTFYNFPSVLLFSLGLIFLMFSLKVFKAKFITLLQKFWPLVLIFFGLALVATFLIQQSNKNSFPYIDDEDTEEETW